MPANPQIVTAVEKLFIALHDLMNAPGNWTDKHEEIHAQAQSLTQGETHLTEFLTWFEDFYREHTEGDL